MPMNATTPDALKPKIAAIALFFDGSPLEKHFTAHLMPRAATHKQIGETTIDQTVKSSALRGETTRKTTTLNSAPPASLADRMP